MKYTYTYFNSIIWVLSPLVLLVLCIVPTYADTYYVAKNGSDDNNGSLEAPFQTLSKAATIMSAGDTCYIKEGVYRETFTVTNNGTSTDPIVFMNFDMDSVVVAATDKMQSWDHFKGSIYRSKVAMPLGRKNMVYCDNKVMDWARWPNNTDNDPYTIDAAKVSEGTASSLVSEEDIPQTGWGDGFVWYLGAHSGASWTREITSQTGNEVNFTPVDITKWPFSTHNPEEFRNGNRGRYYLYGTFGALDHEREWYYNASKDSLYFQAPGNVDPSTLVVEVAMRENAFNITGDYIVIDGIDGFGGQIRISGDNSILRNGYYLNCLQMPDNLDNTGASVFTGAIHVGGSNIIVEHNTVEGSSINGIFIQGWGGVEGVIVRHNYIYKCNTVGIHSRPIIVAGTNQKILSNTIKTAGRDGIYTSGKNIEIAYNDVSDCMLINNDGGVFYTVGNKDLKNIEIHHNWFHDSEGPSYADGRAAGIYLDNDSKGFDVHHNVVWNISWTGLQINWNNTNIDFFNNTLVNVGGATGRWANGRTEQDNRVWNNYSTIGEWSTEDFKPDLKTNHIGSGELEDPLNQNFIPKEGSSLVDMGTEIAGITDNAHWEGPDIGAYERGLTPWIPGVDTEHGNEMDPNVPQLITALQQLKREPDFLLYPNPAQNTQVVMMTENITGNAQVKVFDSNGKLQYQSQVLDANISIPSRTFGPAGIYMVHLVDTDQLVIKKLIVMN